MGLTKHEFMHSTPKILEAYNKAYTMRLKDVDRLAWAFCGNYVLSAVAVAVEACLAGKKAKGKYMETPIFERKTANELSEEDIQMQRNLFVAQLEAMKTNFELSQKLHKQQ